jgi:HEAT repeat protein
LSGEADRWKFMDYRGKFDYAAALEFALASLRSKDLPIRRRAVEYLCRHQEPRAGPALLRMLHTEPSGLRWEVLDGLAQFGGRDVEDAFIALLAPQGWAAKGDHIVPPPTETPPWWPDGRAQVIGALGRLDARRSAPALLTVLQEKGPGKAYLAEFIMPLLGRWGHRDSIPELRRVLADGREHALRAGETLWQLGDRSGWVLFYRKLTSNEPHERTYGAEVFGRCGDRGDLWALAPCLYDVDEEVKKEASRAFERITGVILRPEHRTEPSAEDAPLWLAWYERNKQTLNQGGTPR